jgi:hypothetical protein
LGQAWLAAAGPHLAATSHSWPTVTAASRSLPEQVAVARHLPLNKVKLWNLADAALDVGKACFSHFFYMFVHHLIIYHLQWIMLLIHDLSMMSTYSCSST